MEFAVITAEKLREFFEYSPASGNLSWRVRASYGVHIGDVAGSVRKDGYRVIRADGKLYLAHRLVWLYMHGAWPSGKIDHKDGNPGNNRIDNLRDVSNSINAQNIRRAKITSKDGFLGAGRHKGKWMAQIEVDGRRHQLGTYETPELAHAAYIAAKRKLHEGCTI